MGLTEKTSKNVYAAMAIAPSEITQLGAVKRQQPIVAPQTRLGAVTKIVPVVPSFPMNMANKPDKHAQEIQRIAAQLKRDDQYSSETEGTADDSAYIAKATERYKFQAGIRRLPESTYLQLTELRSALSQRDNPMPEGPDPSSFRQDYSKPNASQSHEEGESQEQEERRGFFGLGRRKSAEPKRTYSYPTKLSTQAKKAIGAEFQEALEADIKGYKVVNERGETPQEILERLSDPQGYADSLSQKADDLRKASDAAYESGNMKEYERLRDKAKGEEQKLIEHMDDWGV